MSRLPDDLVRCFEAYYGDDYYRWFGSIIGMKCTNPVERGAVKEEWAHIAYGDPKVARFVPGLAERLELYRQSQPTIAGWLDRSKARGTGKKPYANAAKECQRFESRVMIQGAAGILMREHPDLPLITIHDAIGTRESGIPIVLDALIRAWAPEGIIPRFKVEAA
jgi:hypothetical protein